MPTIQIAVPHKLSQQEAKARIHDFVNSTRNQYGNFVSDLQQEWNENTCAFGFQALGFPLSGRIHVEPNQLRIEINLPLAALPFKSKIETEMASRAKALLQ